MPPTLIWLLDPRDDLVERLIQRSRGLESEDLHGLVDVGHAPLHVVGERLVTHEPQRLVALDLSPDRLGQFAVRSWTSAGREVEVLVACRLGLDGQADAAGEVAAIGVVADLAAVAQDVQRVLALENLLDEVGNDVAHRQLDVARHDLAVAQRPLLADPDAVERPDDGVGQLVLLPGALGEVLGGELLETVG